MSQTNGAGPSIVAGLPARPPVAVSNGGPAPGGADDFVWPSYPTQQPSHSHHMGNGMAPPALPPMAMPSFPPLLPPGWSEHTAPNGVTKYYYNSQTKQSTYTRPTFAVPPPPPAAPVPAPAPEPALVAMVAAQPKQKKEKAKVKVAVPGTSWQRITTNEGNVFYFDKEAKRSEWTVPEEIKGAVQTLEAEEKARAEEEERERKEAYEQERRERLKEMERLKQEVEEERRKKADEAERKRKAREVETDEQEVDGEDGPASKQARRDSREEGDEANGGESEVDEGEYGPQDEADEAAWMQAVAAEFAEADAAKLADETRDSEGRQGNAEEAAKQVFAMPDKVNVSQDEGRALFKALLIEKDISPFAPWETSLPLFINDPRYVLLPSEKDRREVYEAYCREAGRAKRLKKTSTTSVTETKKEDSEKDYRALLREEVTSTRTRWDDFRKQWKKDRRFYSYGRDDREREKAFKVHLRELGERKRADAQRAEADFFDLLKETQGISSSSAWSEVKRSIVSDPRYDAVGSSSLREELFGSYIKKMASGSTQSNETLEEAADKKAKERKARAEQSLRDREAKVRQEQEKAGQELERSKRGAGREEGERMFESLLVDAVRDHDLPWNEAAQMLSSDPRFNHPSLSGFDKQRLFSAHTARLASKRSSALQSLFAQHAFSLDTPFDDVYPAIIDHYEVKRLGLTPDALEDRYAAWQRSRVSEARQEFEAMLGENKFVDFWGRMRKKVLDEQAAGVRADEMEEGEGLGEGGDADLLGMAKKIDLDEVKSVLRRDARYRKFDHMPEERENWLKDYLDSMEGESGRRTVHSVGLQR